MGPKEKKADEKKKPAPAPKKDEKSEKKAKPAGKKAEPKKSDKKAEAKKPEVKKADVKKADAKKVEKKPEAKKAAKKEDKKPEKKAEKKDTKGSTAKKGSSTKKGSTTQKDSTTQKPTSKVLAQGKLKKKSGKSTFKAVVWKLDCTIPAGDGILDADMMSSLFAYIRQKIKQVGKVGRPDRMDVRKVKVTMEGPVISITSHTPFIKRFLKYLTKNFLIRKGLRNWLRVLASDRQSFKLRYFNIHSQDDEDTEE